MGDSDRSSPFSDDAELETAVERSLTPAQRAELAPSGPGIQIPDAWDADFEQQASSPGPSPQQAQVDRSPEPPNLVGARVVLAAAIVLLLCVVAGGVAWQLSSPSTQPLPSATGSAATPEPLSAPAPRTATAASRARPSAAPKASERPAPKRPQTPSSCITSLLPDDAFGPRQPDLSARCRDRRAYPGALRLKSALVAAAGPTKVTEATREWSKLGWYEIAAYALLRSECCPDAKALVAPKLIRACKLEGALAWIANASDHKEMDRAAEAFHKAARCIALSGAAEIFGREGPPYGGERKYFDQIAARVRKARAGE